MNRLVNGDCHLHPPPLLDTVSSSITNASTNIRLLSILDEFIDCALKVMQITLFHFRENSEKASLEVEQLRSRHPEST